MWNPAKALANFYKAWREHAPKLTEEVQIEKLDSYVRKWDDDKLLDMLKHGYALIAKKKPEHKSIHSQEAAVTDFTGITLQNEDTPFISRGDMFLYVFLHLFEILEPTCNDVFDPKHPRFMSTQEIVEEPVDPSTLAPSMHETWGLVLEYTANRGGILFNKTSLLSSSSTARLEGHIQNFLDLLGDFEPPITITQEAISRWERQSMGIVVSDVPDRDRPGSFMSLKQILMENCWACIQRAYTQLVLAKKATVTPPKIAEVEIPKHQKDLLPDLDWKDSFPWVKTMMILEMCTREISYIPHSHASIPLITIPEHLRRCFHGSNDGKVELDAVKQLVTELCEAASLSIGGKYDCRS